MRKKYKNQLFQHLLSSKYGIDSFVLSESEENGMPKTIITYKNTPFYFVIRNSAEDFELFDCYHVKYAPNFPTSEIEPSQGFEFFDFVINELDYWLNSHVTNYLADEKEPDLWDEFISGSKLQVDNLDFDDQSKFTSEEKHQIRLSLNELKLLIQTNLATSEEQQKNVNARIDYLISSLDRLNRFDWKSLSLSTLIGISTSLSLDTQKGILLFELFKKVFSYLPLLPH